MIDKIRVFVAIVEKDVNFTIVDINKALFDTEYNVKLNPQNIHIVDLKQMADIIKFVKTEL